MATRDRRELTGPFVGRADGAMGRAPAFGRSLASFDGDTSRTGSIRARYALALVASVAFFLVGSRSLAGDIPEFHAYLTPEIVTDVLVGDMVDIHFDVDSTAVQFNGYEVWLQWDPTILDFLSVDGGSLMEDACGNSPFEHLTQTDSTLVFAHVILCAGVSLDGPGRLSTYHFQALETGTTEVAITSDPDLTFFDAGLYVYPGHETFPRQVVFLHNSLITVTDPNAAVPIDADGSLFRIDVQPNPVRGAASIFLQATESSPLKLTLFDVTGRSLWTHSETSIPPTFEMRMPDSDPQGRPLPAGSYLLLAERGQLGKTVRRLQIVR